MFGVSLRRFAAADTIAQLSARVQSSARRGHVDKMIFGQGALPPSLHSAGYMCPALVKAHISPLTLALACSAGCGSLRFRWLDRRSTYHIGALSELRAPRSAARAIAAAEARESQRLRLAGLCVGGTAFCELERVTVRGAVRLCQ